MSEFQTIIGLEIHAQLNTKSKMFCSCDNDSEGKKVNEVTCPICMGMPGTLPVANFEAIKKTIKTGLALGCKINEIAKFDRKHYFYPDLPKGYQISQYDQPFCVGGELEIEGEKIRFNRIHLEEDAGKLIHPKGSKYTIVDLNRAGTPLMEMVTEPDIHSPHIAKVFLQELQQILRALEVSSADMEKGHMRCDANISVVKGTKSSPIVELKNINSFKFVEKALSFEAQRLRDEFESFDGQMKKQTRRFDATTGKTFAMREKEEAKDYRYFPEPDVPPFVLKDAKEIDLDVLRKSLSSLPDEKRNMVKDWKVNDAISLQIAKDPRAFDVLVMVAKCNPEITPIAAKLLVNEKDAINLSVDNLIDLVSLIQGANLPSNIVREIIKKSVRDKSLPSKVYEEEYSKSGGDVDATIDDIIRENPDVVEKYKSGKTEIIGFLVGQAMKKSQGKINPSEARESLIKKMEN